MFYIECTALRAWYNGSTSASQAEDEGSIPFARTIRFRWRYSEIGVVIESIIPFARTIRFRWRAGVRLELSVQLGVFNGV